MSWVNRRLDQLGQVSRGRSRHRPRDAAHLYGGPFPFIQTGDVKHAGLYINEYQQTYSEAGLAQSKLWPAGTLCITIAANIADTAILGIDACFPDSVIGFIVTFLVKTPAFRRERLQSLRTLKCQPIRILDHHDRVQQRQPHGFSPPLSLGVDYEISIPGLARRLAAARSHGYRASGRRNERS